MCGKTSAFFSKRLTANYQSQLTLSTTSYSLLPLRESGLSRLEIKIQSEIPQKQKKKVHPNTNITFCIVVQFVNQNVCI